MWANQGRTVGGTACHVVLCSNTLAVTRSGGNHASDTLREEWLTIAEVEAHLESREVLSPASGPR